MIFSLFIQICVIFTCTDGILGKVQKRSLGKCGRKQSKNSNSRTIKSNGSKGTPKNDTKNTTAVENTLMADVAPSTQNQVSVDTILGKHMVGYQGWFTCKDGYAEHHWNKPHLVVDMLPDVSEYDPNDLCILSGYHDRNGDPIKVFSSASQGIVDVHFRWMKEYGIDGVFVQDFLNEMRNQKGIDKRLNITENVKNSAEKYGRAWAIMFDASSTPNDALSILKEVIPQFNQLIQNSPMYLHEHGKPLVAVWGFGGEDKHITDPKKGLEVVKYLKDQGFSVYGGFPKNDWREGYGKDATWTELVNSLDVLSPWTVGSPKDYYSIQRTVESDIERLSGTNVIYSSVIYPGFSWKNLNKGELNSKPRDGGNFYSKWAKASLAGGAKSLYTAMFDEVNEGTAIFKTIAKKEQLPVEGEFVYLDIDGYDLESDHYLKLAGNFSSLVREAAFNY